LGFFLYKTTSTSSGIQVIILDVNDDIYRYKIKQNISLITIVSIVSSSSNAVLLYWLQCSILTIPCNVIYKSVHPQTSPGAMFC